MKIFCLAITTAILFAFTGSVLHAQTQDFQVVQINPDNENQTITGFGASLAYYEGWLTAHPNRAEIYDVIFSELSLDILRVRNAFGYDDDMIGRVKQFAAAAENSLGHPIDILVTSWSPPGYVKSNNDRNNGGTLRYTVSGGNVNFDYAAFANWWNQSLDNYNTNGIFPKYISIQNEPDWKASYESCLLRPSEYITATDTIAGYNKALDAVYDTVMNRENHPVFLGPECIGIGYNAVENYINALDITKLHGIAHHLYHGAEGGTVENDPFTSDYYKEVGNFHPEVPHFQTEYSRSDWFSLAAMMYQSLAVEGVTAFLYWDLIWDNGGLVNLYFPWDRSQWGNSKGYNRTKDFFVFKHFSRFIHPGWKCIGSSSENELLKTTAFISSVRDSAAFVAINRSETDTMKIRLQLPGFQITQAAAYSTTELQNFVTSDYLADTLLVAPPKSVNTIDLRIEKINTSTGKEWQTRAMDVSLFPNPFSSAATLRFVAEKGASYFLEVTEITGRKVRAQKMGFYPPGEHQVTIDRKDLKPGIYIFHLKNSSGETGTGRFVITDGMN